MVVLYYLANPLPNSGETIFFGSISQCLFSVLPFILCNWQTNSRHFYANLLCLSTPFNFLVNFASQALNTSSRITNWSIPLHINFYCHEALQPLSIFSTKRSQLNNSSTSELKETLSIKTNYMNFSSQSFWKTDIHWLQLGFLFWKKNPTTNAHSLFSLDKKTTEKTENYLNLPIKLHFSSTSRIKICIYTHTHSRYGISIELKMHWPNSLKWTALRFQNSESIRICSVYILCVAYYTKILHLARESQSAGFQFAILG